MNVEEAAAVCIATHSIDVTCRMSTRRDLTTCLSPVAVIARLSSAWTRDPKEKPCSESGRVALVVMYKYVSPVIFLRYKYCSEPDATIWEVMVSTHHQ